MIHSLCTLPKQAEEELPRKNIISKNLLGALSHLGQRLYSGMRKRKILIASTLMFVSSMTNGQSITSNFSVGGKAGVVYPLTDLGNFGDGLTKSEIKRNGFQTGIEAVHKDGNFERGVSGHRITFGEVNNNTGNGYAINGIGGGAKVGAGNCHIDKFTASGGVQGSISVVQQQVKQPGFKKRNNIGTISAFGPYVNLSYTPNDLLYFSVEGNMSFLIGKDKDFIDMIRGNVTQPISGSTVIFKDPKRDMFAGITLSARYSIL